MQTLNVGQVVFVFDRADHSIIPVQVFEEVVHRKISGIETSYYVRASSKPGSKTVLLDLKKEKVFSSIESAREFMIENATKAIDEICREAIEGSSQFQEKKSENKTDEFSSSDEVTIPHPTSAEVTKVGVAKVKLPTGEFVDVIID